MRKQCLGLTAILLLSAVPVFAQRSTATIRGTVRDATLPDLPIGHYKVEAELQGFKKASRTGVILRVADDFAIDFELEAGGVNETVSVEASSTPVKVLGGDVSGVVTGEQVRELPLNGRNFLQLATLMPGVSAPDFLNVKDKGLLGGSDLSVSGGDVTANLWTVDGANNNDVGSNRTLLVYPSLEGIQEFKILRNSYGSEFGGAGGAQINIVTRGGTNQFNGSAFYSGRSDAFNSKDYFLKINNQPKAQLKRNDFGGSIGGPIIKDKLHFFSNVEWNLEDRGTPRVAVVPTQAERNGDFSGTPSCNTNAIPKDPLTGNPFLGNRIPANQISPAGQAFLNLYALPNLPSNGCNPNWVTSVVSPIDSNQFSGRADWTLSNSTRVMVRYTQDGWKNKAPSVQANLWGDDPYPSVDSNWNQPSRSFVASLNQTLGTSATNTLQFSYSANKIEITRGGLDTSLDDAVTSKLLPIFPYSTKQYGDLTSHPVFWGGGAYGSLWNEAPFNNNQDLFVIKDDYTRVFGKHFLKAGVLISANKKNEDTNGNGSAMHSAFWGAAGLPANSFTDTGNVLSNFLLKDMSWGFSEQSTSRSGQGRWHDTEFYVSDSWQVSRRVTFDYGVRYSLFFNPYSADDTITSFVPALFNPALGNDPCNGLLQVPGTNVCKNAGAKGGIDGPNPSLQNQDNNNFAPRLGVAWDMSGNGKTALRAGIGQFFLRERMAGPFNTISGNPPFVSTISGARTFDSTTCFGCGSSLGSPHWGKEVDQKTPNNWQWNLSFQHELFRKSTIEVGYVANYGYDLLRMEIANQVLSGDVNHNGVDDRLEYAVTTPANASLRQFGVFGDGKIATWVHSGKSTYNSLQTQWITRFGRGSQFQTSYTLSRSRANLGLTSSGNTDPNNVVLDNQNPDADWGRPDAARTHIYNASLIYLLPTLEDKGKLTRGFFGDWEITTIVGAGSGQPVTIFVSPLPGLTGGPSGTGFTDNQRPNRVAGQDCRASGDPPEQIINPAAYTLVGFNLGSIGTAGRGDCDGPGYFQTDLAFYKNFRLTSGVKVQFRWDIFNFFNNTNFKGPSGGGTGGFNNTMSPSSVTLNSARTQITNAVIPATFGQATATRDPRQMQFGFKLLW
jgi:hypothetical protein